MAKAFAEEQDEGQDAAAQQAWLDMFFAACEASMAGCSAAQLARLARAVGELGVAAPPEWQAQLLDRLAELAPEAGAGDVADLLWALAVLDVRLDPDVLGVLLQRAAQGMGNLNRGTAADLAWAIAALGYRPSDGWLDLLTLATYRLNLARFPSPYLSKLVWALASFQYQPPTEWLEDYVERGACYHPDFTAQGAAAVLWSLAVFQVTPEELWVKMFFALTSTHLEELPPDGLVNVAWSLAAAECYKLAGLEEGPAPDFKAEQIWLDEWYETTFPHLNTLDAPSCVKLLWALSQLRLRPSDEWLLPLLSRANALLQAGSFEAEELAYLALSASSLVSSQQQQQQGADPASSSSTQRAWPAWFAAFVRDAFDAASVAQVNIRRLNIRFPPYAVPHMLSPQMPFEETAAERAQRFGEAGGALVGPRPPLRI